MAAAPVLLGPARCNKPVFRGALIHQGSRIRSSKQQRASFYALTATQYGRGKVYVDERRKVGTWVHKACGTQEVT